MRTTVLLLTAMLSTGLSAAGTAAADPAPAPGPISAVCNDAFCTPGITPNVTLGAPCENTQYYVFATAVGGASTLPGRLVFCGSPRRYEPRYFRTMPMVGIKEFGTNCSGHEDDVAQAPDGLFLTCGIKDGESVWVAGGA